MYKRVIVPRFRAYKKFTTSSALMLLKEIGYCTVAFPFLEGGTLLLPL
jgi:hypothetical protein